MSSSYLTLAAWDNKPVPGPDARITIMDRDGSSCGLFFVDGRCSIRLKPPVTPDLLMRSTHGTMGESLQLPSGPTDVSMIPVVAKPKGEWARMFPLDVAGQTFGDNVRGANAVVQRHVSGSPVGAFSFVDIFTDGLLESRTFGLREDADVIVTMSFAKSVASLRPEQSILERIDGARVDGRDAAMLMLVASLYESVQLVQHLSVRASINELLAGIAINVNALAGRS